MERTELARYYMRILKDDEKEEKLRILKEQKKILKQRLKAVNNYQQIDLCTWVENPGKKE